MKILLLVNWILIGSILSACDHQSANDTDHSQEEFWVMVHSGIWVLPRLLLIKFPWNIGLMVWRSPRNLLVVWSKP